MQMAIELLETSLLQSDLQLDCFAAVRTLKLLPFLWHKVRLLDNVRGARNGSCESLMGGNRRQKSRGEELHGCSWKELAQLARPG